MRLTSLVSVATLVAAVPAYAVIAWSGDNCNGAQGADVPCDGSCHDFSGRHSFRAGLGGGACVTMWTSGNCQGQRFNFSNQGNQCTNVNTGTDIRSFYCYYSGCH
ncbi:hypothetical protein AURDEDRAFT_166556 [Auricularia subglabra TFB-10046 SS5]|nr:hypothetical protein AURDEDRAFT_166556 [Auricularia subglabra TFB-10046 SS5]